MRGRARLETGVLALAMGAFALETGVFALETVLDPVFYLALMEKDRRPVIRRARLRYHTHTQVQG